MGLVALLLAEATLLLFWFDLRSLLADGSWWARLLENAQLLSWSGYKIALATLVFGVTLMGKGSPAGAPRPPVPARRTGLFLLCHLVAFLGLAETTRLILARHLLSTPQGAGWALALAVMGLVTLLSLAAAVLPRWGFGAVLGVTVAGVAAFAASLATMFCGQPLTHLTLWFVHGLIQVVYGESFCMPEEFRVGTPSFYAVIGPGCSGYEGIGLIWVFLSVYLWAYRKELRFPRALLLLPLGTAAIWLGNAVRIVGLIGVGMWVSPKAAMDGFHTQAGWILFNVIALGLVAATRHSRFFSVAPLAPAASSPSAVYLAPLLALVASFMVTMAFSSGFDYLYPVRVLAVGGVLWYYRRPLARFVGGWSWTAAAVGVAAFALWMALEPAPSPTAEAKFSASLDWLPPVAALAWLVFRVAGSVITAPIAEELAFRGYLTRRLMAADFERVPLGRFSWMSFLVSSALFGVLHGRWLAGTLAGMLYALALYRRGRLSDAVLAHATTNALIAGYVLVTGSWSLWG
jgi:exosortase E/protease (VPEID-CTERM system)